MIPESFPTELDPIAGIFIKDQVKAISSFATVAIFNTNPWYRGVYEQVPDSRQYDFHQFSNKPPSILKPIAYRWWERQSFLLAKKIPKPDIIHLHGATLRGPLAIRLAFYWSIPLVITEHTGPWSAIAGKRHLFLRAKKVLEKADVVLAVSDHLRREILNSGIDPVQIKALGNPVDTAFFTLRKFELTATKTILYIGRLDPFKGAMRTLRAFAKATDRMSGYRLMIAGAGLEAPDIESYISDHKLEHKVEFLPISQSREEMRSLFHRVSFLVFPSLFESFGLVAAEAMSTGLPVLITDRTGPKDYSDFDNSIAIDPEDVGAIADGMVAMTKKLDGYNPVAISQEMHAKYGVAAYANAVRAIYETLAG